MDPKLESDEAPPPVPLAVFDFDRTLTPSDTSLAFLGFAAGRARLLGALTLGSPLFPADLAKAIRLEARGSGHALGSVRGWWGALVHQRLVRALLGGRERAELEALGRRFAREALHPIVSAEALEQVAWHRARGERCVLATASLDLYMEPWGRGAGFDRVLATRVAFDPVGRATGDFGGEPCWGEAKLRRLQEAVGSLKGRTLVAYGGGPGDRALLERADHPMAVRNVRAWPTVGPDARARLGER
jgi:HAD superfamily hydrolase (TIGR01490 family)